MEFLSKKTIIKVNRQIIKDRNEKNPRIKEAFYANDGRLDQVLDFVKNKIIKAAYIMAGISRAQPFVGANK